MIFRIDISTAIKDIIGKVFAKFCLIDNNFMAKNTEINYKGKKE